MRKISTLFKKDPNDLSRVINEVDPQNQWVIDGEGIPTRKYDGTACTIIDGEIYKRYDAKLVLSKDINIGDTVSKTSGRKFKNGNLIDVVVGFEIIEHTANGDIGAVLKNSNTILKLGYLQVVGKFTNVYKKPVPTGAIPCQEPDLVTGHHPHWLKCDHNKNEDKYFFDGFNSVAEFGKVKDGTYELVGERIQGNPEKIKGHHLVKHGYRVLMGLINPITFENIKEYLELTDIEGIVFHNESDGRMCKIRQTDFGFKR